MLGTQRIDARSRMLSVPGRDFFTSGIARGSFHRQPPMPPCHSCSWCVCDEYIPHIRWCRRKDDDSFRKYLSSNPFCHSQLIRSISFSIFISIPLQRFYYTSPISTNFSCKLSPVIQDNFFQKYHPSGIFCSSQLDIRALSLYHIQGLHLNPP